MCIGLSSEKRCCERERMRIAMASWSVVYLFLNTIGKERLKMSSSRNESLIDGLASSSFIVQCSSIQQCLVDCSFGQSGTGGGPLWWAQSNWKGNRVDSMNDVEVVVVNQSTIRQLISSNSFAIQYYLLHFGLFAQQQQHLQFDRHGLCCQVLL